VRAIDTNVVVRLLTNDDPEQGQSARMAIECGDIFVPITVVLETEWVLRSGYGLSASEIAEALRRFGGLPGVTFEEPAQVAQALDWLENGRDFADALHLARSSHCTVFVTFDRKLARRAKGWSPIPVEAL
jgi:predicted nucleic-acid-binding protein